MTTETKRDIHADLALCEAAVTTEDYYVEDREDEVVIVGNDGMEIAEFYRLTDAEFYCESREGWPESLRRAIAAEARLKEAEAEVERLRDENHTLTLTVAYQDEWKAEAERLRAVLERFDDRRHAMMPRSQMARIAKEALDANR
ncbi:hypothetical protein [Paenibacillus sp. UASWS1643]|uniref:hypothetical protein n=1 Tax=Paenibacillus sp. UASWS1643 TaxID=2580422 RepID=UPI001239F002|nr:hypothetical protein [Paenibacillus sp. UASWS1643]KAA8750195.1 hypothetical protein FE296_16520 [Paenibacillus sp. UASWS1643]